MWKENLEGKIDEIVKIREEERVVFEDRKKELEYGIYVHETLRRILKGEDTGFLQESSKMSKETLKNAYSHLSTAIIEAKTFKYFRSYAQVFKVLSQITVNLEQVNSSPLSNKVFDLIEEGIKKFQETLTLEEKAE